MTGRSAPADAGSFTVSIRPSLVETCATVAPSPSMKGAIVSSLESKSHGRIRGGSDDGFVALTGHSNSNQKVLPKPTMLSTPSLPPFASTSCLTIASPRPLPPNRSMIVSSACVKLSKILDCASGAIPIPVSETSMRNLTPSRHCLDRVGKNGDTSGIGEFQRVADEIDENLLRGFGDR